MCRTACRAPCTPPARCACTCVCLRASSVANRDRVVLHCCDYDSYRAIVATRNSFHLCRIGAWAEQCARAGFVSMHHTNVIGHRPLCAPHGGYDARYSTNPYTVGLPVRPRAPCIRPVREWNARTRARTHGTRAHVWESKIQCMN